MKKLLAMLLAMVMVFSLAACAQGGTTNGVSATEKTAAPDNNGEKDSSTSTGDSDSIDVGVCLTITGSGAPNGLIMLAGVQEYVDMVNEKGGVNGKQIKLHIQDAGNDSDACLNAMNLLEKEDLSAIIGPHGSGFIFAAQQIIEQGGIPCIGGGTNYKLPTTDNNYLFLGRPSDAIQAKAIANYVVENTDAKTVGMCYCATDFGQGAYECVKEVMESNPQIKFVAETHNEADTDFSSTLLKMQAEGVDVLILCTTETPMPILLRQAYELGLHDTMEFYGSPCIGSGSVQEAMDLAWLEDVYCVQESFYDTTNATMVEFGERTFANYGMYPDNTLRSYEKLTEGLVEALRQCEDPTDPEQVKDALQNIHGYQTIFGTVDCDDTNSLVHEICITKWNPDTQQLDKVMDVAG